MSNTHNSRISFLLNIINVALMTLPFAVSWLFYYTRHMAVIYYYKGNAAIIAISALLYFIFCQVYEGFDAYILRKYEIIYSQGLAAFISDFLMYFICWLLTKRFPAVLPMLLVLLAQVGLSALWVLAAHTVYRLCFSPPATALIHGAHSDPDKLRARYRIDENFNLAAVLGIDECLLREFSQLENIQAVFIYGIYGYERDAVLEYCMLHRLTVYMLPGIGDIMVKSTRTLHLAHAQILRMEGGGPSPEFLLLKRAFDIVASLLALLLLSPLLIVTALAIKLCDGGPVLYRQRRLTKDGKEFDILKFRSMRVDAEKDGVARLSTGRHDERITPVGRIIRKVRIDELPQLLNILRGDMSIVGPRPERPEIAARYESSLPEFSMRLLVKAGLTGYAQVYGQYNSSPHEKLQMDLMYIANASILEDLRIITATVKILFIPESTEGVEVGCETAADGALDLFGHEPTASARDPRP